MSLMDKISGRFKKAAGDVTGDKGLHEQGRKEERKSDVKEQHADAQAKADSKAEEAARLENQT